MTTFTARIPGDDRTGHFTQEAVEHLIGQTPRLTPGGDYSNVTALCVIVGAVLDGTDAIVEVDVLRGALPAGMFEPSAPGEFSLAACMFALPDEATAECKDLSRIDLRTLWEGPPVPARKAPQ